jgi:hypothetical protein
MGTSSSAMSERSSEPTATGSFLLAAVLGLRSWDTDGWRLIDADWIVEANSTGILCEAMVYSNLLNWAALLTYFYAVVLESSDEVEVYLVPKASMRDIEPSSYSDS